MQYYKQDEKTELIVGSYKPSENWSKYTHYAVMDANTTEMVASVGYFLPLGPKEEAVTFEPEDYIDAAESIEVAQLYANAPDMYKLLERFIANGPLLEGAEDHLGGLIEEARFTLAKISDIREAADRLLGENGFRAIAACYAAKYKTPVVTPITTGRIELGPKKNRRERRKK